MKANKIRLLHLVKVLQLGGVEKSTIKYSNILQKELDFVGIYAAKGFYDDIEFINKNVKRYFPPHNIWEKFYFFQNLKHLATIIKKERITHLHYHHRIYMPFILLLKVIYRKLEVIYTHHSIYNDTLNYFLITDKIIALNDTTKQDLPKYFDNKIVIIPHGIHINKDKNIKLHPPRNIGYAGRFVENKGILDLIKAFKKVNDEIGNTKLIFVGEGPLKGKMLAKITELGLIKKVEFKEPSIYEKEIYSYFDILVLPSEKLEAFGLVILEAMSFGIPSIVKDLSIYNGFVKNKYNGLIAKENLSKSIIEMINSANVYNELRKNSIKTSRNFDIYKTISQYIKLYLN